MSAQAIPVEIVRKFRMAFQFFDFLENRKRINTSAHRNHLSSVVQKGTPLTLPIQQLSCQLPLQRINGGIGKNNTQKDDRACSFFITCFIPVDGEKNPLNLRIFRHGICCSENRREKR